MDELWVPIENFEGYYAVSNLGRVKSLGRVVDMIDGRTYTVKEKLLKLRVWNNKYHCVVLYGPTNRVVRTVHSLVADAFLDRPLGDVEICHSDGDYINNSLSNLYWGTKSDNAYDSVRHGMHFNANKQTCVRGHLLEDPNLMNANKQQGARSCLACSRGRATVSNAKKKGVELELKLEADKHYLRIMKI